MKSIITTTVKIVSLSIILFSFAFGVYAQHNFENILAENTNTAKHKTQVKTTNQSNTKLSILYSPEIFEEAKKVEDWMFKIKIEHDVSLETKKIEKWMLDEDFWNIEYTIEQEPTEKEREIEEWMKKFDFCISTDRVSGFVEKDWMKQHSFYIL
jgi:hypothetical protein